MDMNQYLDIFVEESREHLQSEFLPVETKRISDKVFSMRYSTLLTLKGMSGTMGLLNAKAHPPYGGCS